MVFCKQNNKQNTTLYRLIYYVLELNESENILFGKFVGYKLNDVLCYELCLKQPKYMRGMIQLVSAEFVYCVDLSTGSQACVKVTLSKGNGAIGMRCRT